MYFKQVCLVDVNYISNKTLKNSTGDILTFLNKPVHSLKELCSGDVGSLRVYGTIGRRPEWGIN